MNFFMIICAKYAYLLPILLAAIFILLQKRAVQKQFLLFAIISLPLTLLIAKLASHLYYDPRPFVSYHLTPLIPHAPDNGFPSDHTLISAAFADLLFIFNKKWGIIAGIVAILVGVSRVYVRVHSPIDVIASLAISLIVVYSVKYIFSRYFIIVFSSKKEMV